MESLFTSLNPYSVSHNVKELKFINRFLTGRYFEIDFYDPV